jgi:hypothetical protein
MPDVQPRVARARQFVTEYAEAWQREHVEAMECAEFEADLAEGVAVFRLLESVHANACRLVFDGAEQELLATSKELYAKWAAAAGARLNDIGEFERRFGSVVNGPELRECVRKARAALTAWPVVPSPRAVGSRPIPLSEEEAAELHALRDAPPDVAGKRRTTPQPVPPVDGSILG